jgi:hypothetical protein
MSLEERIDKAKAPDHWECQQPNDLARNSALKVCKELRIEPTVIAATVEEGIFMSYKDSGRSLTIECYNDGDIAWLINDDLAKKVLKSGDISSVDIPPEFAQIIQEEFWNLL